MNNSDTNHRLMPRGPVSLMYRVYRYILPEVRSQLAGWRAAAELMPDPELRKQALASIAAKQFHCEGGAVYAAANLPQRHVLIPLIVAFQTISDYLDNLCDRSTSLDPLDFRLLHQSMLDAVNPAAPLKDYYSLRMEREDGGYLDNLVKTCQSCICMLPAYSAVQDQVSELVSLYCDLQVYKHIRPDLREQALQSWWELHQGAYPQLRWNEFAAATGSTLGVFMLFLAAADKQLNQMTVEMIRTAYFPNVCGLHILLDYLIDQEEDRLGGDLNFCNYYDGMPIVMERIGWIVEQSRAAVKKLPSPEFHRMIVEGLLALYLSDPKVSKQREVKQVSVQLVKGSPLTRLFFFFNSKWIRGKQS